MSACRLPDGQSATRPEALVALRDGKVDHFLTGTSGQTVTLARALGMSITTKSVGTGVIEVRLGARKHDRPSGAESATANLVSVLTINERDQLKRLLRKLISAL